MKLSFIAPKAEAETLADALEEHNPLGTIGLWRAEGGQWTVEIYLEAEQKTKTIIAKVLQIAKQNGFQALDIKTEKIANKNWVAEGLKSLKPLQAGRFYIHGRHDRDQPRQGPIDIEVEAGLAFGTGHHASTHGCLMAFDALLKRERPQNILDLGCGSGILAIAAAKAARAHILASDIDAIAVGVANTNARLNGVGAYINAIQAEGIRHKEIVERAPYDVIFANILAGPLFRLAPDLAPLLARGGRLILAGLLAHQAPGLRARYRSLGFVCAATHFEDGWAILQFT